MAQPRFGFTLAELLIALAILGVIATFTIPKILSAQQNEQYKATAKENIGMLAVAYQQYQLQNGYSTGTGVKDLTPYMNYAALDTSGAQVDDDQLGGTETCDAGNPCVRMHNGSTMRFGAGDSFGGTAATSAVIVHIDPDGRLSNNRALAIFLYYNGKLADEGNILPGSGGGFNPDPNKVPPWFTW